jgi:organic hydroperoxide reductase OsmC/OhrA
VLTRVTPPATRRRGDAAAPRLTPAAGVSWWDERDDAGGGTAAGQAEVTMGVRRTHRYDLTLTWTGNRGTGTSGYRDYGRDHEVGADGRPAVEGSADRVFHGDKTRWNPELELVAALAQCHMLSYLHVCTTAGVVVTAYDDTPYGVMAETGDGGGHFTEVVLRPSVTVASAGMAERAATLHKEASEKCFIASSVNFPVRHEPSVTVAGAS